MRRTLALACLLLTSCSARAPARAPEAELGPLPPAQAPAEPVPEPVAEKTDDCASVRTDAELTETIENRSALGSCEEQAGKMIEALKAYQRALELSVRAKQLDAMKASSVSVRRVIGKVAHLQFTVSTGVNHLQVWFDDRPVPADSIEKRFAVDAGDHRVRAEGVLAGRSVRFEERVRVDEAANVTVALNLQ